jgi:hypothetical protein
MNWKFWEKKEQKEGGTNNENLPKPKSIPEVVGRHLVVEMKKDPDYVWKLMAVRRPRLENKNVFDVRVYSPTEAGVKGVKIKNYDTLNSMPELILFEGWYDKRENTAKLVDNSSRGPVLS